MSLLSKIPTGRRLKINQPTAQEPEQKKALPIPEAPPSIEEVTYSRMVEINPALESLVDTLGLVSLESGEALKALDIKGYKLKELAQRILSPGATYTQEELVNRITEKTGVQKSRAIKGFNLLLEKQLIKEIKEGYLINID